MSRLDSFIRRMTSQKILLEYLVDQVNEVKGPVLELGLGNGRTYDHLREIYPDKEIFVFDFAMNCHPSCAPDAEHMILGDIRDTLAFCGPRVKAKASFAHIDIGSADPTNDLAIVHWLAPLVNERMAVGGFVLTALELDLANFERLEKPEGIHPGRYHIYRKTAEA
ncbi:class I SAM-dependent methyltransferase [Roseibium sediminicola]|uniref:Class I SAM-dependent methyltransferase n=1 Tax=Roseibium sediminicola TaxID=2933272 RepID=A0ABT0GQG2_9HYPH|nr:class I SAM-dependent methyltransferase [Roseibium sp. CAU 1639]MCK7611654.1 class I SAM-dependent methyltransferase [Roseibium sp. CAU 1639]